MDAGVFIKSFIETEIPQWPCPSCQKGILMLSEKSFHYFETAATKREMNSDYFEAEWTQYVFTGVLSCNICEESVVFSGDGGVEQDYEHDEQHSGSHFYRFFTPRYFYPPVPIIRIPASEKVPDDVTSLLTKSFGVVLV
jgi:hypothetical protein